jgi:integrase
VSRETSPYIVGNYWLDKRRDGKSPTVWQIARYEEASRSVIYRSTRKSDLADAKAAIIAHDEAERARSRQDPRDARVIPLLFLYWRERGKTLTNHDQTGRSLRTFIAFLIRDEVGMNAVVTDLVPTVFERFRQWRMGKHAFEAIMWDGRRYDYASEGVSGDTVDRNLNDIRAAINHAQDNMRIAFAPKVKAVESKHKNPLRERVLTMDELARIAWYSFHFPALFRFVALQMVTSVRPEAAKKFDPTKQYNDRTKLIDLQPGTAPRTKKRNAIIPAIRPMRVVLRAWARDGFKPVDSNKTAWRTMRAVLGLSDDVFPKTIRHTIATMLYQDESVPERQVSEMLGHEGKLNRTSRLYAKYDPNRLDKAVAALTTIWRAVEKQARAYAADHLLTTGRDEQGKILAHKVEKV